MISKSTRRSLAERFLERRDLAAHGLKADVIGKHSVRISHHGRYVGLWREVIGAVVWAPADPSAPQRHVLSADEAIRQFNRDFGLSH
jgi:hypothetical protein